MTEETAQTETSEPTESAAPAMAKPLILGRKLGMLQHFKADGSVVAATVIAVESNLVTAVMTKERNGYAAVQIGFGEMPEKKMSKGERGHLGDLPPLKHLREVRVDDVTGFSKGQRISADRFSAGDKVTVIGTSKGKGFQGPVHLHHFTRGPKSHGSDHLRRQGSVGSGTTPGRVLKGLRMAAHQGVDRVTVRTSRS
jgi:large subunit ribosomal protein L3